MKDDKCVRSLPIFQNQLIIIDEKHYISGSNRS